MKLGALAACQLTKLPKKGKFGQFVVLLWLVVVVGGLLLVVDEKEGNE